MKRTMLIIGAMMMLAAKAEGPRMACQLWSVRDIWQKNPTEKMPKVFAKIHKYGFEGVQSKAFWDLDADFLEEQLKANKLQIADMPITVEMLDDDKLPKVVAFCKRFKVDFVYVPWFGGKTGDEWRKFIAKINAGTKKLQKEGIRVGYHNHAKEFNALADGTLPAKLLTEDAEMCLELDVGPATVAGWNAAEVIRKMKGRVPSIHAKPSGGTVTWGAEDGTNWPEIMVAAKECGMKWIVIECEKRQNTYEDVAASLLNFRSTKIEMPKECTNPDGMCVDAKGRLVIAAPNNDRKMPGAIFRLDAVGGTPYKWLEVPPLKESGYAQPMGVCFGPEGELYVCDCQKQGLGRLLRCTIENDRAAKWETIAEGLDNANGVKYLNGKLYLTQAFLYGVKRADGAATSGLYMFDAKARNVRVTNMPEDAECVFSDITKNPKIRGGLNGVAVIEGNIYTGNYGDGRIWKLMPGADGKIAKSELFVAGGSGIITPDGFCAGEGGALYVADMRGNALVRVKGGRVKTLRQGVYERPSEPCIWNGCVVVANYGGTSLSITEIGKAR